jgi:hypothetical protein
MFDGASDGQTRLTAQIEVVRVILSDHKWHTLVDLQTRMPHTSDASISARIRDLRKPRFGGHVITSRRVQGGGGTYEYRLEPAQDGPPEPRQHEPDDVPLDLYAFLETLA